jgi:hypothetical protein
VLQSTRYRVVEVYYDAKDKDLLQYVEPQVETTFLSILLLEVVDRHIWPLIIRRVVPIQSIQAMVRVRRVCKGRQTWVDHNNDWTQGVLWHLENNLGNGRPWYASSSNTTTGRKSIRERMATRSV